MFLLYTPEEKVTSLQERWEKYLGTLSCSFCINVYVLPPPHKQKICLCGIRVLRIWNFSIPWVPWPRFGAITWTATTASKLFPVFLGLIAILVRASLLHCWCISNAKWNSLCPLYLLNGFHFNLRKMYWRSCVWHGKCVYLSKIATCLLELQCIMYNAAFSCACTFPGILLCQSLESLHKHW